MLKTRFTVTKEGREMVGAFQDLRGLIETDSPLYETDQSSSPEGLEETGETTDETFAGSTNEMLDSIHDCTVRPVFSRATDIPGSWTKPSPWRSDQASNAVQQLPR